MKTEDHKTKIEDQKIIRKDLTTTTEDKVVKATSKEETEMKMITSKDLQDKILTLSRRSKKI